MKSTKFLGAVGLIGVSALASMTAQAMDPGWYLGGGLGQSVSQFSNNSGQLDDYANGLPTSTPAPGVSDNSNTDIAFKLFGGYQINKYLAVEGGYFDLGQTTLKYKNGDQGNLKVNGLNIDTLGFLPITPKFSAFARLGLQYADTSVNYSGTGVTNSSFASNSGRLRDKEGLGLQYALTPAALIRGEWETYRINNGVGDLNRINVYSVDLVIPLGGKKAAPVMTAAAPVVVPEPAREPAPAPAPALVHEHVTLDAESLFALNKADLSPKGKAALRKFADHLRNIQYQDIKVVGYTDRLGSDKYNMKLSERRADAVKAYLVKDEGIPADKIMTEGKGKADPVTKPGDCKGKKATKKLVNCLQPDRRVEVEVSGVVAK